MEFVCPQPTIWNKIHQNLTDAWLKAGSRKNPPPVPLILNGWVFSNDYEKHRRWQETIQWAKQNGVELLISELAEDEKYYVEEFGSSTGY